MAKRKRRHRKSSRRVGAVSFAPGSPLVKVAAIAAGYFLGDTINTQVDKVLPASMTAITATGITGYIPAAAELGIGGLLLLSKKKSIIKTAVGGVLAGAGLRRALKKAGVVSGFNMVPVINGFNQVPVIGGVPPQLGGVPPQLGSYITAANRQLNQMNGFRTSRVLGGVDTQAFGGSGIMANGTGLMS
jgi:hypothetical protein